MFIVVSGEVHVLIASDDQKESRYIAKRSTGDYVGEMSIISREPRIATLIAAGQVRALCQRLKEASLQQTN